LIRTRKIDCTVCKQSGLEQMVREPN